MAGGGEDWAAKGAAALCVFAFSPDDAQKDAMLAAIIAARIAVPAISF
jgi:hypothetical protein